MKTWSNETILTIIQLLFGGTFFVIFTIYTCKEKTCEDYYKEGETAFNAQIILTKDPSNSYWSFDLRGLNLKTREEERFNYMPRELKDKSFSIGDTFIKNEGQNFYIICRKKHRYYHLWYCKNNEHHGTYFIDSFYQYLINETPHIDSVYPNEVKIKYSSMCETIILDRNFRERKEKELDSIKRNKFNQ